MDMDNMAYIKISNLCEQLGCLRNSHKEKGVGEGVGESRVTWPW